MNRSFRSLPQSVFLIVSLVLFSIFLSSCMGAVDMDITVYADNRYQQEILLSFSADEVRLAGGVTEIEKLLDEMVTDAKSEGTNLSWRQLRTQPDDGVQYEIRGDRREITNAGNDGFVWREESYNNRKAYRFEYVDLASVGSYFQSFTLTLHAGRILDSNGTQVDARTVRWVNPSRTPYAIVQPKSAVRWLPVVAAGLLLVATGGVMLILVQSGRLKTWGTAGVSSSKWRVQAMKLKNDRTRMEKDKTKLVSELGVKAWESRVMHPTYAELYDQLESLEQQRVVLAEQKQTAEQKLQQVQQTHSQTEAEYSTRIGKLQEERNDVMTRLKQLRSNKTAYEKRLSKAQADQQKTQAEVQSLRGRLSQVQSSDAPDREAQAASISNAIAALEQSLTQMVDEIPHVQSEIARLDAEQQPLSDEIARLEQQIAQVQAEQREMLAPLDRQIVTHQEEIRALTEQLAAIAQQMTPLVDDLGPCVDRARPESPALANLYTQLDQAYRELANISQQHDLLKVRLGAADTGAVKNFWLLIGGLVLALVLIIILLVVGLA